MASTRENKNLRNRFILFPCSTKFSWNEVTWCVTGSLKQFVGRVVYPSSKCFIFLTYSKMPNDMFTIEYGVIQMCKRLLAWFYVNFLLIRRKCDLLFSRLLLAHKIYWKFRLQKLAAFHALPIALRLLKKTIFETKVKPYLKPIDIYVNYDMENVITKVWTYRSRSTNSNDSFSAPFFVWCRV